MVSAQRTRMKVLAALIAGSAALGCGSDGSEDKVDSGAGTGMDGGGAENDALKLTFSPMYSAYIQGSSTKFKLPVKVEGAAGKLTVTTTPDGFVDADPSADGVMLTMKKSGDAVVHIRDAAGNTGKADLHVTEGTDSDLAMGKDRYSKGPGAFNMPEGGFMLPEGGFPEGGMINLDAGIPAGVRNADAACSSCHTSGGASGTRMLPDGGMIQIDVEHTPQQTGGYTDEQLVAIFTMGKKPEGAPYRIVPKLVAGLPMALQTPALYGTIYAGFHKWDMMESERKGVILYLRSLEPKSQPEVDFGGLLPPRGALPGGMTGGGAAGGAAGGGGTTGGATVDSGSTTIDSGSAGGDSGALDAGAGGG